MPTGTCNFPGHHSGPSAGQPVAWLVILAIGAVVVAHWHAVLVCLAIGVVLVVTGVIVVMLWHSHRSLPYDAAWSDAEPQEAPRLTVTVHPLAKRVAELERQLAERAIGAPQQHLHLHGIDAGQAAAIIRQQQEPALAAIEDD